MERLATEKPESIVWLYRGEVEKYQALLDEYRAELGSELGSELAFVEIKARLQDEVKAKRDEAKAAVELAERREKKGVQARYDDEIAELEERLTVAKEVDWLYEKFGEGEYKDIPGLCKIADRKTILEEKGCSLTPGTYVGVAPVEDDGVDFAQRMAEIHRELFSLQAESNVLMDTISKNLKEIGL